jgi:phospholipid/cholesterol/gamma-HCH transport system substrate-binding protein/paraquat-inducible protein B
MSLKPNYFKIGVFVIAAFVLIISAIVVFGAGLFTGEELFFETYFDSSVSGLNIGAPMENRGVRMGQVEKITFASNEYDMAVGSEDYFKYGSYVMVLVSVNVENVSVMTTEQREENLKQLVARGLRIRLATNLLTGQAYLQGTYLDPKRFPTLEVPWEPKNYYISSAPSDFTTMKQSLDSILSKLEEIDIKTINDLIAELLVSVNKAVDDANVPEISSGIQDLVASADKAVEELNKAAVGELQGLVTTANQAITDANVPVISSEIQNLLVEARQTNQHLQELLKKPEKTSSQMANVAAMIANLNKTLLRIDRLLSNQTPQIDQTLENLRAVSEDLKELTNSLKQHPSQLIFSEPPSKPEVSK